MSDPILRAVNLTKMYPVGDGVHAIDKVSLSVRTGEFVLIMGPSGCGKSTLLNLLGGLDRPTHGEIMVDGKKYSRLSEDGLAQLRRSRIGFVFQSYNLLNDLTAAENISLPMYLLHMPEREINRRTTELLETVGMMGRANHSPFELSGGEQQRVAIARALANKPAVILADEPTGNLDSKNGQEIMALFRRLNQENGQTFIVVSHDHGFADHVDRVITMGDGHIIEDTNPVPMEAVAE